MNEKIRKILILKKCAGWKRCWEKCRVDDKMMLTLLFLLWTLIRGLKPFAPSIAKLDPPQNIEQNHSPGPPSLKATPSPTPGPTPEPTSQEISDKPSPSPEPDYASDEFQEEEESSITRISSASRPSISSRYSDFATSRTSSIEVGNESRNSITSLSSSSLSWRRSEMSGQRSIDSRTSLASIFSTDVSRRDSEVIFEQDDETTDPSCTSGSGHSGETTRRYSDAINKRRRSSARGLPARRYTRKFPLNYDRRRTTGR